MKNHVATLRETTEFIKGSLRRKTILDGVEILVGTLLGQKTGLVVQSYIFDGAKFTMSAVKTWLTQIGLGDNNFTFAARTTVTVLAKVPELEAGQTVTLAMQMPSFRIDVKATLRDEELE